jgi:ATP-binding cassette subfamily B protein
MHPSDVYSEDDHHGKPVNLRLLPRLWPFIRPRRRLLAAAVALVIGITLLDLTLPYITKIAIDRYIVPKSTSGADADYYFADPRDPVIKEVVGRHHALFKPFGDGTVGIERGRLAELGTGDLTLLRRRDLAGVAAAAAVYVLIIAVHFVLTFAQMMIMEYAGQMVMHDLRIHLFAHVQGLDLGFFSQQPTARLVTRVTNDVQNMHELFTSIIVFVFKDVFLLAGIAAVLLGLNWSLALVSFAVLPLVLWASVHFAHKARDVFRDLRTKVAEINTRFAETIAGMAVIQLFLQEKRNAASFAGLNHANYLAGMRQIHVFAVFMPVIEMLGTVAVAVVIFYGGGRVLLGTLTLGGLVAFISYMRMFFRPMRDIAEKYNVMQDAMASAERIFGLLDTDERLPRIGGAPAHGTIAEVCFDKVSFRYLEDEPLLQDLSFTLARGKTMAVVGPTGAGKTTLIHLLLRFYDPTGGRILVNGQDIRQLDIDALRRAMALVSQDPFLFSATLADNIRMGNPDLPVERLQQILTAAQCEPLASRLADGADARLSEGGRSISSGERQLVAIARAMARDPELIILDEATSYIDSQTEAKIQQAMANLIQGRTALVVAHRLSTARQADSILVLHRGRVIEQGTHDELMARKGFYFGLQAAQIQ